MGARDIWHEFLGDPTTEFSSATGFIPFTADLGEAGVNSGLVLPTARDDRATLYGNVNYQTTFENDADAWEGNLGIKVAW